MKAISRTNMRTGRTPLSSAAPTSSGPSAYTAAAIAANNAANAKIRDPVQVFCRIRPLQSDADLSCLRIKNNTTVVLSSPDQALHGKTSATTTTTTANGAHREMQYIFKHVFEPNVTQREVYESVAQPLVENLIRGRNSLLFTYGVTGSGKTYTMTGDVRQRGIMPRCLDALFRTISDYQAKKFVFKPDRLNGFEILSEADALLERQIEMNQRFAGRAPLRRKYSDPEIASQASCDAPPISGLDEDNMFAVFVTYIEIYNNSVYDLLEETGVQKNLQSKIIREDANHNMFVHGVTEIEIKSVEEALEAFHMGQKRKRMGHTVLNAESSRSHSVFNIRLVQAPTDCQGEHVLQDKRTIIVSQLSLVDLAGSERSSRTKNTGMRLREAGNINNSLMTLRTCLEYLRENQQSPNGLPPKKIPYRDSKITHMFKNYFDGEGQISMIVCINPRAEDYDENTQVLKFAEMTQEVQIVRATPMKTDLGLTPGRRKANKMFKVAINNLNDLGHEEAKQLDIDVGLVYSLGTRFPEYNINSPEAETAIQELMEYLLQRIEKRKVFSADLNNRCDNFRVHLMQLEKENLSLRTELAALKCVYKQERERSLNMENRLRSHESSIDVLNAKLAQRDRQIDELMRKLSEQQYLVTQKEHEKEKQKKKFNSKMAVESDRKDRELEIRLREQRAKLQEKMRIKDEKIRLVSNIMQSEDMPILTHSNENQKNQHHNHHYNDRQAGGDNLQNTATAATATATPSSRLDIYATPRQPRGVAAANNRHRRSRSAGDKWLEHRAANPVPLGTIMQPYLKNHKSVTKLTDMKELTGNKTTKYCLVSQDADTDGDVETKLYKGNVIPTCGGGAQVVFDDVECLKQKSPLDVSKRKRPSYGIGMSDVAIGSNSGANIITAATEPRPSLSTMLPQSNLSAANADTDVHARCNMAIEGHSNKRSKI